MVVPQVVPKPTPKPEPTIDVLELRVHGIANSPPAEMLEARSEDVEREEGDLLGSFWRRRRPATPRADDDRSPGITREAYSWGFLARTGGGGAIAVIGRVLVHLGWLLVLPFALCNLAYWTRKIEGQRDAAAFEWNAGRGSVLLRLFALILTLVYVAAFMSVAVDLLAVQCFRDGEVCAAIPPWLDGLVVLDRDARSALFGVVPIVATLVIYLIARRGRVSYEANVRRFAKDLGTSAQKLQAAEADTEAAANATGEPKSAVGRIALEMGEVDGRAKPDVTTPLLATRGFWALARVGQTSERLHFAAAVSFVVLLLCLDSGRQSSNPAALPVGAIAVVLLVLAASGVAWSTSTGKAAAETPEATETTDVGVGAGTTDVDELDRTVVDRQAAQRAGAALILAGSGIAYVVWAGFAFGHVTDTLAPDDVPEPPSFGLIAAPNVLVAIALALALGAAAWEDRRRGIVSAVLLPAALVLVGIALLPDAASSVGIDVPIDMNWRWMFAGAAGLCVLAYALFILTDVRRHGDPFAAWRGLGPSVVMILALFASMFLSSLLVLGVGNWLSSPADAGEVGDRIWRTPAPPGTVVLDIPNAYERFAVVLLAIVLVTLVVVLIALVRTLLTFVRYVVPDLAVGGEDVDPDHNVVPLAAPMPPPYPARAEHLEGRERKVVGVRRASSLLHRGEPLFAWLAGLATIGLLALMAPFVFPLARERLELLWQGGPAAIRATATSALVLVSLAIVAAVAAHAASSGDRPIALFWDVVCFFPRAGHPFAPPCYAERAVPELRERVLAWLSPDPAVGEPAPRPRSVILAVHSMGATIAAAAILSLRIESVPRDASRPGHPVRATDRISLLTYGIQLRPYFSRFFPSVFGPDVLGVPGTRGPSLWKPDPWTEQVEADWEGDMPAPSTAPWTLTEVLGASPEGQIRWRSLWRRTDYLGFPVFSYRQPGNPIDRGASERAPTTYLWRIARHNDYLGTKQYRSARDDLVEELQAPPPSGDRAASLS